MQYKKGKNNMWKDTFDFSVYIATIFELVEEIVGEEKFNQKYNEVLKRKSEEPKNDE